MEILIPAGVSLVTVLVKKLTARFGVQIGGAVVLVVAFVLSGVAALVFHFVPAQTLTEVSLIFGSQMAIYEVVYKRILKPVLDALGLKLF